MSHLIAESGSAAIGSSESRPWEGIVPDEEQWVYEAAGFGRSITVGRRPALLVIDMQYRSIGEEPLAILESIRQYQTSCGEYGWRALPHIVQLIAAFRRAGFPVIYPYVAPKSVHDGGRFSEKAPSVMQIPPRGYEFIREIAPEAQDVRLPKHHASAFFGTPLVSHLIDKQVDSVFVVGATTSGCVRASVVDASQLGFNVVVPQECVFDRSQVSHAVNLFDMSHKYAEVVTTEEALIICETCSAGS